MKLIHSRAYYIINGITLYRIVAAPVLLLLVFTHSIALFPWLLSVSFFTDFIDGFLARRFKVSSVWGTRIDSIGDDLTVMVAIIALFYFKWTFVQEQVLIIIILFSLFLFQTIFALIKYKKISSFHTYLAKLAAFLQGIFFLHLYFTGNPNYWLFYGMAFITAIELVEEICLVAMLDDWTPNVKGLYWVKKRA